jgi:hypothetical protein
MYSTCRVNRIQKELLKSVPNYRKTIETHTTRMNQVGNVSSLLFFLYLAEQCRGITILELDMSAYQGETAQQFRTYLIDSDL